MFDKLFNEPLDKVDSVDIAGILLVVLGAASVADIATLSFLGYGFGDTLYTIGSSTDISLAIFSIFAGAASMVFTNGFDRSSFSELSDGEKGAVATLFVVPAVVLLSPDAASFVTGSNAVGIGFTAVHAAGAVILASE